ncbi:hypothetical protein R1X32_03905 (plasmid) [Rhodococcus opacus]|uniref:hypothetical protein n=1 Tax=Rhodococcus opacus TaxID=37919 RepID=UPI0034D1AB1A
MGIRLKGFHRVVYGVLENTDTIAAQEGWTTSAADTLRRNVLHGVRGCTTPAPLTLISVRGNWIVALAPIKDRERARALLDELNKVAAQCHPDLRITWGSVRHAVIRETIRRPSVKRRPHTPPPVGWGRCRCTTNSGSSDFCWAAATIPTCRGSSKR